MASKARFVVVRSDRAGVFAGNLVAKRNEISGVEVDLINARRIWYWCGAASLSQLAQEGVKKAKECKFSVPVAQQTVFGIIEILDVTPAAQANILAVPEWKM